MLYVMFSISDGSILNFSDSDSKKSFLDFQTPLGQICKALNEYQERTN